MGLFSAASVIRVPAMPGNVKSLAVALCAAASIPALMAGGASAADLSYKDERPAIASYGGGGWSGFYFGVNAGWSNADNDAANPFIEVPGGAGGPGGVVGANVGGNGGDGGTAGGIGDFDGNDGLVGLHVGYNWQAGNLVYGVEGDIGAYGSLHDLLGTLRGRIGYATPRTLFYATAGLAYLSVDGDDRSVLVGGGTGGAGGPGGNDANGLNGIAGAGGGGGGGGGAVGNVRFSRDDDSEFGFVGGLGIEHKLSDNVSFGVEGLYYTFDDDLSSGLESDFFTIRARLTMHLQGHRDGSTKDSFGNVSLARWSGFYVGGHAGALVETSDDSIDDVDVAPGQNGQNGQNGAGEGGGGGGGGGATGAAVARLDDDLSFLGGIHAGYNFQSGQAVYGLEGDASFGEGDKYNYLASVRARLGYASGSYLFYATAGIAFAGIDQDTSLFANAGGNGGAGGNGPNGTGGAGGAGGDAGVGNVDDDLVGFVVGAGVETKVNDRLSLGFEGLYYGFEGDTKDVEGDSTFIGGDNNDVFVLRGRVSYSLSPSYEALK
jgi:opacity protein-like surface antigen